MNWVTIAIAAAVLAAFLAVIITAIRNKKKGKFACSCGASCQGCAMSGSCRH